VAPQLACEEPRAAPLDDEAEERKAREREDEAVVHVVEIENLGRRHQR
jgi:hypothetical protein